MNNIKITQAAIDKVASLRREENNPQLGLRVFISGGGCSGFQYGFTFDENSEDDDLVLIKLSSEGEDVKFLIDAMSLQYLQNAEIDYVKNIQGEQFVIRNPNAKTTCGCGSSFSIEEEPLKELEEDA